MVHGYCEGRTVAQPHGLFLTESVAAAIALLWRMCADCSWCRDVCSIHDAEHLSSVVSSVPWMPLT